MTAAKTGTRLGAMYRRIARKRGKQKAIVAVSRVICEIAWNPICDPAPGTKNPARTTTAPAAPPARPRPGSARSSASSPEESHPR